MFRETLRILLIIGLNTMMGVVTANVSELIGARRISYELMLLGAVGGFLSNALIVPLIWRRNLVHALALIYGAALVVGASTGLVVGGAISLFAVAFAVLIVSWIAHASLPLVYPDFPPGLCASCGYDLRGSASGTCPECGLTDKPPNRTESADGD